MVDAQGRDGAKLCSSRLGTQTEPQGLVGIWRGRGRLTDKAGEILEKMKKGKRQTESCPSPQFYECNTRIK